MNKLIVTTCDLALPLSVSLSFFVTSTPLVHVHLRPPSLSFSLLHLLTPSDCNGPANRSEDPDSDSDEAVHGSQAAVHSDYG